MATAAKPGYTDYIMALKEPVSDATIKQAKADVESAGGEVTYEIKTGLHALICSLPNERITTFDNKNYVDFMEQDQEVHIMQE
ncbi:hypothetical protein BDB00DRAFT_875484 [Zychaea mexicana]|uniref:uncharacterized protein n=1 Tax=Zychaea mexicana TaxID=64656 RepID=UPI0022FF02A0|nr:uncharacterized protein BDB00DRAFT_875484 [Zychaea mexicana]KAI9490289.1 hypothetical protein BDB00DRAFT_875484 [Zychaea mexicana]